MTLTRLLEASLADITFADIDALIAEKAEESPRLDLKLELPGADKQRDKWMAGLGDIGRAAKTDLAKEVVAFANAYGGVIVVGVDESKDDPPRASAIANQLVPNVHTCAERLADALQDLVDPPITSLEVRGVAGPANDGSGVLIIRTRSSIRAPHGHGTPPRAYMRRGSSSDPMTMREMQSVFFETRTRAERIEAVRADRSRRLHEFSINRRGSGIRYDGRVLSLSYHGLDFRCTAIATEPLGLKVFDGHTTSKFERPDRSITTSGAAPALGQGQFSSAWRPRAGGMDCSESGTSYFATWHLGDDGVVEARGFRRAERFHDIDHVVVPAWFTSVVAQVMALAEQLRRKANRVGAEFALDCEILNPGGIVRTVIGIEGAPSENPIADDTTRIGPFTLGRFEDFQDVFTEVERQIWNGLGLHVHERMKLNALEWFKRYRG